MDEPAAPQWAPMSGDDFSQRIARAEAVRGAFSTSMNHLAEQADAEARAWFEATNPDSFVGSRHHTVPRFLLERWANDGDQVRVFRRMGLPRVSLTLMGGDCQAA